jgi:hypothetical protein
VPSPSCIHTIPRIALHAGDLGSHTSKLWQNSLPKCCPGQSTTSAPPNLLPTEFCSSQSRRFKASSSSNHTSCTSGPGPGSNRSSSGEYKYSQSVRSRPFRVYSYSIGRSYIRVRWAAKLRHPRIAQSSAHHRCQQHPINV